jgi:glycosyltransferase involved in cell wall biosynthesis
VNLEVEATFLPVNPRLPGIFRHIQRVKYVRTFVVSIVYFLFLLLKIPRMDVVHVFSASYWSFLLAPVPAIIVGKLFQKHVIINYHSGEAEDHLSNWRSAKFFLRFCDVIVVPSDYLVDVFNRHGFSATAVPNFIEIERFPYRERRELQPIFFSNRNFQEHYNVSCILRAFSRIQAQLPHARLVIAGDGPLRERLHNEASNLGLRDVQFVGLVPPDCMPMLYDQADVYLNASDIDNMPISILEAAACGLPIVSTDAGGIPYILQQGTTGLMVPCNDDEALAREALRLFSEPGLALRLASVARSEVLARYTWNSVESGWLAIYRQAGHYK